MKMNVQVWVSGKNYAYVFSVKDRGMEKSWEKVKKFGRQALSSQISEEKEMGILPCMHMRIHSNGSTLDFALS